MADSIYCRSDPGLNRLFSDRAEELVLHGLSNGSNIPKQEYPDRIYGLRETKVFENALSAVYRRDESPLAVSQLVRETIRCSPLRERGEPLLFPFLILESKSEKGQDCFDSIQMQTAMSIRTLLKTQVDLARQCGGEQGSQVSQSLVWFLASKGDMWRVYAGYAERPESNLCYVRDYALLFSSS